jgi:hypothetical protein
MALSFIFFNFYEIHLFHRLCSVELLESQVNIDFILTFFITLFHLNSIAAS